MTEHSAEIGELAAALSAAQGEFTAIPKDSSNPFFNSKYASLAKVIETASPILAAHGIAITKWIGIAESGDILTTVLLHKSGQFVSDTQRLYMTKMDPQSQGSATTYARRYAYMAALGLAPEDDDGERTRAPAPARAPVAQPTAKPPERTEPIASAASRGLINARAGARGLAPTALADIVRTAIGAGKWEWRSEEEAQDFLRRTMDRLPAKYVDPVLQGIDPQQQLANNQ